MEKSNPTVEEILQMIAQRNQDSLRDERCLLSLFADYAGGGMAAQQRQLAIFCQCGGHTLIQKLRGASQADQKLGYHRLIQEMESFGLRREVALDISGAYWRAALGTEPPETAAPQPSPAQKPQPAPAQKPEAEEALPQPAPVQKPRPTPQKQKKPQAKSRSRKFLWPVLAAVLLCCLAFALTGGTRSAGSKGGRTSADLAPFQVGESVKELLLAGTEETYTYPDGTRMEFYFNEDGKEVCRAYVDAEGSIENLFTMLYDSSGRLTAQWIYDSQGTLLREDTYDFHSSADTAQHRIELADGSFYQGVSTFDQAGNEAFELPHGDGSKTVTRYNSQGLLIGRAEYDAAGEIGDNWLMDDVTPLYAVRDTVIGKAVSYGDRLYVWGLRGNPIKEYDVDKDTTYIAYSVTVYDMMGTRQEWISYNPDGVAVSHSVYQYDANGTYCGYEDTYYVVRDSAVTSRIVTQYNQDDVGISSVTYDADGNRLQWSQTELDEAGRQQQKSTYDAATGQKESVDEWQYDQAGNLERTVRTYYYDSGKYSITVQDGDGKRLSDITYFPDGQISDIFELNAEGKETKWTRYYENGTVSAEHEYNSNGNRIKSTLYYESGAVSSVDEYDPDGKQIKSTLYYESGTVSSVDEYDSDGNQIKSTYYEEDGTVRSWDEYVRNADGSLDEIKHHSAE